MSLARRSVLLALPGLLPGCNGIAVGAEVPRIALAPLPNLGGAEGRATPGIALDEFRRGVTVLNVWASWCPYCQSEHPTLLRLAGDRRFRLVGLVSRDAPEKAAAYLRRAGNPYAAVAVDDGRYVAALGPRGIPASYVVEANGRVHAKILGPLDEEVLRARLFPAIERALARRAA